MVSIFCYLSFVSIIMPAFPVGKLLESSSSGEEYKAKETLLLGEEHALFPYSALRPVITSLSQRQRHCVSDMFLTRPCFMWKSAGRPGTTQGRWVQSHGYLSDVNLI